MKKLLVTVVLAIVLAANSVPVTAHAADVRMSSKAYIVIGSQECESLREILKRIIASIGSWNIGCPTVPDTSETETPEQPDTQEPAVPDEPDTQEPVVPEAPDTQEPAVPEEPGIQEPVVPETPDTQEPAVPDEPDIQEPVVPETPDTQEPATPEAPDTQEPDDGDLNETVHPYVIEVLNLVNNERAKAGLSALRLDADVTAAANVRAKEITRSFSHTRPNGSSFSTVLKEQGVTFVGSGENIAWGQKSPEQVMDSWMNSDGHRANILNQNFKNIGIGYYQDENGRNYWVQLFTW